MCGLGYHLCLEGNEDRGKGRGTRKKYNDSPPKGTESSKGHPSLGDHIRLSLGQWLQPIDPLISQDNEEQNRDVEDAYLATHFRPHTFASFTSIVAHVVLSLRSNEHKIEKEGQTKGQSTDV